MGSKKIQLFLFKIITVFLDWVFPPLTLISAAESDPCLAAHSTISNFWSQLRCGGGNFRHHFYILVSTALWGFLLYSVSMARYNGWLIEPACVVSFLRLLNSVKISSMTFRVYHQILTLCAIKDRQQASRAVGFTFWSLFYVCLRIIQWLTN